MRTTIPWTIGSTEYAQERASGFWRWRDSGVPPRANRRSQANVERLESIRQAEARFEGEWMRIRVDSVRPDGLAVTVWVRASMQEAASWRKRPRLLLAERVERLRGRLASTPVEPPERRARRQLEWTQVDGDSVDAVHAWALAAWRRRYLCGQQRGEKWTG